MAAIWRVYTLNQAAKFLSETKYRVSEAGSCMPPEEGCLTIYGPGANETMGFTETGPDNVQDYLIHMPPDPAA